MKGAFTCPYCMTSNACDCEACKPDIKDGEYVNKWTDDGEMHICGKCNKIYSPDQALDAEYLKGKYGNLTAVSLLGRKLLKFGDFENLTISWRELGVILEEAKQLEKWQIIDSFNISRKLICNGEQYYNETFPEPEPKYKKKK